MIIQGGGIALLALLLAFLSRSISRPFLSYWTGAWASLAVGVWSLYLSFCVPPAFGWIESFYFGGEYLFGFLLMAGIRAYASGRRIDQRDRLYLPVALATAAFMPYVRSDFASRFFVQAILLAAMFAWAAVHLFRARALRGDTPGLRIMAVALITLVLNFLVYPVMLAATSMFSVGVPAFYASYNSIYDLILELLLGFGMIALVMEDGQREVEQANRELKAAQDRLEELVRRDALTESLNRHAFYSTVERARQAPAEGASGAVALVDIDDLKAINDRCGHASGDLVIRAVARAIRALVRADDLVFRWGGDEFLVLVYGLAEEVRQRLGGLSEALDRVSVPGSAEPIRVSVSFGIAAFEGAQGMDRAIEQADSAMYRSKQARKAGRGSGESDA
jgi:diguanylate cyclase (GGDEF)-like protein